MWVDMNEYALHLFPFQRIEGVVGKIYTTSIDDFPVWIVPPSKCILSQVKSVWHIFLSSSLICYFLHFLWNWDRDTHGRRVIGPFFSNFKYTSLTCNYPNIFIFIFPLFKKNERGVMIQVNLIGSPWLIRSNGQQLTQ